MDLVLEERPQSSQIVATEVCKISIPHTHRDCFDYKANGELPSVGARVWVPFRKKERLLGVVVGIGPAEHETITLKSILAHIDDEPLMPPMLLALCKWVSTYYHAPLSEVIPLALPKRYRRGDARCDYVATYYQLSMLPTQAYELLAPKAHRQRALVDLFVQEGVPLTHKQIVKMGFSTAQKRSLLTMGVLVACEPPLGDIASVAAPLALNDEQAVAVSAMLKGLESYQCFLLQGVTGSGKTEVYLHVIAEVLARKQQVLVLVPEIGLTPQLLSRFSERFRVPMVVMHSHLNDSERQAAWQMAGDNAAQLVIGTRSAVFAPMPKLGLIIVDEEHDSSLKQMDGVRYSARDTALMRAYMEQIPIVLGSATPSLESMYNCERHKYQQLRLTQKALNSTALHYTVLDIRNQTLEHGLASKSLQMIQQHLEQNNQVLVFINRRGFSPVLMCHRCGWMADCRACDSHLTMHRSSGRLMCHHCGVTSRIPTHCQACKEQELLPIGVGTQRVQEYLSACFPSVTVLRMDRDVVRKKKTLDAQLERINSGEAQLMIGTQMLAKGHHFPRLTLVVILDADNGFYNQDFRALEQLGQLLIQVSGRAGRAEFPGQVVIQTHLPQHPLLNILIQFGYDAFAQRVLSMREEAQLPPYYFLALLRVQGRHQDALLHLLHALKADLSDLSVTVLGPAPAPLARIAHQHRMQLLIKSSSRKLRELALMRVLDWFLVNKLSKGVRWNIDVDPMDLS